MVPDLLDCARTWKSEAPDFQSKLFREQREAMESWHAVLHTKSFGDNEIIDVVWEVPATIKWWRIMHT
jgi:hypothetical protein